MCFILGEGDLRLLPFFTALGVADRESFFDIPQLWFRYFRLRRFRDELTPEVVTLKMLALLFRFHNIDDGPL